MMLALTLTLKVRETPVLRPSLDPTTSSRVSPCPVPTPSHGRGLNHYVNSTPPELPSCPLQLGTGAGRTNSCNPQPQPPPRP